MELEYLFPEPTFEFITPGSIPFALPDGCFKLYVTVSMSAVATLEPKQADGVVSWVPANPKPDDPPIPRAYLPEHEPLSVRLSYPLGGTVEITIQPYEIVSQNGQPNLKFMSIGWVLWCVAKTYEKLYREPERYGIWGHDMGDLVFESIRMHGGKGNICLGS